MCVFERFAPKAVDPFVPALYQVAIWLDAGTNVKVQVWWAMGIYAASFRCQPDSPMSSTVHKNTTMTPRAGQ
jgi:hypothetical protein